MTRTRLWISALTLTAVLASAGTAAAQSGPSPAKLQKQIAVIEKFINEDMVESKVLLVPGHEVTRGIYLQEFGVLFTLQASVITPENEHWKKILEGDEDDDDEQDYDKAKKKYEERERVRKEMMQARQKNYEIGKNEIRGALLDYGGTLASLRDNQWVGIAAFIDDHDYFGENNDSETVFFRAKMSDLRAHDQGQLNEQQILARVLVQEY